MVIHGDHTKNLHKYGAPISSDVAVLMIRDGCDIEPSNCNILLSQCDNGWHPDLPLLRSRIKKRVTQMQFYSYRLQIRNGDWIQNTGILNAIHAENSANNIVHHIILPSSFSGES
ncbi:3729_t:CDS:2 [Rhizophagus irregularis]|nr:3729_t:CDS:2 [Rhizophagus irregularis]